MTWRADETSIEHSEPREMFVFADAAETFRITSYQTALIYAGQEFESVPSARSSLNAGPATEQSGDFMVDIPARHALATYYSTEEPDALTCEVHRYQARSATAMMIGAGYVTGMTYRGGLASFRISNTFDAFATDIPSVGVSRLCQNILFDSRCGLNAEDFDVVTNIGAISSNRKVVTVGSVGGNVDHYFRHGHLLTATGVRRTIVSQVGTTVTLLQRLPPSVVAGAAISIFAGCDKLITTCLDKFDNVRRFRGAPYLPKSNPFYLDIRSFGG